MTNLKELVEENRHKEILQLESPLFDRYKVTAAILLKRYRDALIYIKGNTYEKAYCFYKLKEYKRALRIIRNIKRENKTTHIKLNVLAAQCLYYMNKYDEAYGVYRDIRNYSNEYAVNMSACEALNSLCSQKEINQFVVKPNKRITNFNNFNNLVEYSFTLTECKMECDFNNSYRFLTHYEKYMAYLIEMERKYIGITNSYFQRQLDTMQNKDNEFYTKKQKENYLFNVDNTTPSTCELFQKNFYCLDQNSIFNKLSKNSFTRKECSDISNIFGLVKYFTLCSNNQNSVEWCIKQFDKIEEIEEGAEIKKKIQEYLVLQKEK